MAEVGGGELYYYLYASGGGGASDIRIEENSLYARIIVAGGGSGRGYQTYHSTAGVAYYGGGETSEGYGSNYQATLLRGGVCSEHELTSGNGTFGFGASSISSVSINYSSCGAPGAGGGWYGGATQYGTSGGTNYLSMTAGGSGYVYNNITALYYPSGCLLGAQYYMSDTVLSNGGTSFLAPSGTTETGHTGHGYARITYIGEAETNTNANITNFLYTGAVQEYTVPITGKYTLEVWGAQGGIAYDTSYVGGKGGYSKGLITLEKGTKLYIYVGGLSSPAIWPYTTLGRGWWCKSWRF